MSELPKKKWYQRAWPWGCLAAVALLGGLIGFAIGNYLHIDGPRHWWPDSADEWSAWGTWTGAIGALVAFFVALRALNHSSTQAKVARQQLDELAQAPMRQASRVMLRLDTGRIISPKWKGTVSVLNFSDSPIEASLFLPDYNVRVHTEEGKELRASLAAPGLFPQPQDFPEGNHYRDRVRGELVAGTQIKLGIIPPSQSLDLLCESTGAVGSGGKFTRPFIEFDAPGIGSWRAHDSAPPQGIIDMIKANSAALEAAKAEHDDSRRSGSS